MGHMLKKTTSPFTIMSNDKRNLINTDFMRDLIANDKPDNRKRIQTIDKKENIISPGGAFLKISNSVNLAYSQSCSLQPTNQALLKI